MQQHRHWLHSGGHHAAVGATEVKVTLGITQEGMQAVQLVAADPVAIRLTACREDGMIDT